jgi:hypothetical protein
MTKDKVTETLVGVLKQAIAEPKEQRLFKSGKLDGLFPGRSGIHTEAANWALRDGLLEVVRTETRGKTTIDWVRSTPRAVQFVHEQEAPLETLKDLRRLLQTTREGLPVWLAEMRRDLQTLVAHLTEETGRWTHRLDYLSQRVEEAIRRLEAGEAATVNGSPPAVSWIHEALVYLDRRRDGGAAGPCPLPELFAALRQHHADLSVPGFHEGLRRLHERHALRLLPFTGPAGELPEPEYALTDGAAVLYFAAR